MERRPAIALKALMVLTAVDMMIALVVRLEALQEFLSGEPDWLHVLAVSGLAVIVLAVLAMWASWPEVRSLWVRIRDADGRLDAVGVTSHDWHWQATPDWGRRTAAPPPPTPSATSRRRSSDARSWICCTPTTSSGPAG
jgi:hypothetical protein